MTRVLEEALARCLARLEAGVGVEECLADQGALAAELRPLLEAARELRLRRGRIPEHEPEASRHGRARMHSAREHQKEAGAGAFWVGLFGRPAALVTVAAAIALFAALGFAMGLFSFGADTTSAHVEGVVSRVDPDGIVLTTDDGQRIIRIGDNTIILDAEGNVISGGDIVPGRPAKVKVEDDDELAATIEVEDEDDDADGAEVEFSGLVESINGDTLTVQASFGAATIRIGPETEVKGTLAPGVEIEVHAILQGDGSYLAREIEVEGAADDDLDDSGESSGSGSGGVDDEADNPDNSGHGSSGGSGDDEPADDDEEETEHS